MRMSLLPYLLDDYVLNPTRLLDQHFGLVLDPDDLLQPLTISRQRRDTSGYFRNWKSAAAGRDTGSTVSIDKDRFQAHLDVQQFKPEEISVKVTGENMVTVEGKHEEKPDEHGLIYRHFTRKYVLPTNCDVSKVESKLSSDGVLTVTAPRQDNFEHKTIPITRTGEPVKQVEQKSSGDK